MSAAPGPPIGAGAADAATTSATTPRTREELELHRRLGDAYWQLLPREVERLVAWKLAGPGDGAEEELEEDGLASLKVAVTAAVGEAMRRSFGVAEEDEAPRPEARPWAWPDAEAVSAAHFAAALDGVALRCSEVFHECLVF